MTKFFFDAMEDEPEAIAILERELGTLLTNKSLILADRPGTLILATRSVPGSLYEGLIFQAGVQRSISYAMFAHSTSPMPGTAQSLEIQRFEFQGQDQSAVLAGGQSACGAFPGESIGVQPASVERSSEAHQSVRIRCAL